MSDRTQETVPVQLTKPKTSFIRESFTSNFWMSGLEILKCIPRYFRVKQVDGSAFFTEEKLHEFWDRVLRITRANPRQWGTMTVAQMLHHLLTWPVLARLAFMTFQTRAISYRAQSFDGFSWTGIQCNQWGCAFRRDSRSRTTQRSTSTSRRSNCSRFWMPLGTQDRQPLGSLTRCSAR